MKVLGVTLSIFILISLITLSVGYLEGRNDILEPPQFPYTDASEQTEVISIQELLPLIAKKNEFSSTIFPIAVPASLQHQLSQPIPPLPQTPSGRTRYDSFPKDFPIPDFEAEVHQLIKGRNVSLDEIFYRYMNKNDIPELLQLHKELLPVDFRYTITTYIWKNPAFKGVVAVLPASSPSPLFLEREKNGSPKQKEYLVGFAIFRGADDADEVDELHPLSIYWLRSKGEPFNKLALHSNKHVATLGTFGVIDELCGIGIGSRLLALVVKDVLEKNTDAKMLAVHVLPSNLRGIRFYSNSGFQMIALIPDYYTDRRIGDTLYMGYHLKNQTANEKLFRKLPSVEKWKA